MTTTPPTEAIAAAANQYKSQTHEVSISDDLARKRARMILVAAAPFIVSAKTAEGVWTMTDAEFKRELAQAKAEAFQAVRDAAEYEPDQVGDYGMVELPGYLTIDARAFDALDKDDRERLHITADDYAQEIEDAQAQAKAEALREAAFDLPAGLSRKGFYNWLRSRAATIEGKGV